VSKSTRKEIIFDIAFFNALVSVVIACAPAQAQDLQEQDLQAPDLQEAQELAENIDQPADSQSLGLADLSEPLKGMTSSECEDTWKKLAQDGTLALDRNQYWIAEPLLTKAVVQAGHFGTADLRLAKSLGELGRLYTIRGRFVDAESYLEEKLFVEENVIGKNNTQIIPSLGSLIHFYLLYGTASKADPLTEDLLALVEGKLREPLAQTPGKIKLQKGVPLQGWAGSAAPIARDPLIEWAITCDDLGLLYRVRGNFDLADRLFKAALDLKTTVLGKEHLSLANSYDSLGEVCLAKNDYKEAETYFQDALALTEKILPPEDPKVYARLDKLARCLIKLGKYQQAEDLYLRAQSFWKGEPSNCGLTSRALFALGCLYADEKKYAQAAPVLQQALASAEEFHGPASVNLVPYLRKYAYVMYYLDRRAESDQLKDRISSIADGT